MASHPQNPKDESTRDQSIEQHNNRQAGNRDDHLNPHDQLPDDLSKWQDRRDSQHRREDGPFTIPSGIYPTHHLGAPHEYPNEDHEGDSSENHYPEQEQPEVPQRGIRSLGGRFLTVTKEAKTREAKHWDSKDRVETLEPGAMARRAYGIHSSDSSFGHDRRLGSWRPFLPILATLVCVLVALGLSTVAIQLSDTLAREVDMFFFQRDVRIPPPGLRVEETSVRRVTLASGLETFFVIGKIVNQTEETFEEVAIEAMLFDSDGNLVGRGLGNAGAALAPSAVTSLPTDLVFELQKSRITRLSLLPAGTAEFALAVEPLSEKHSPATEDGTASWSAPDAQTGSAGPAMAESHGIASYYSARVYTVKG